jgi:hypothetical protein
VTSFLEFNARAMLCRRLAKLEPDLENLWLAEAERWSRFTREPDAGLAGHGDPAETCCCKVPKVKPSDVEMTEPPSMLWDAVETAPRDPLSELLRGMSLDARE